MKRVIREIASPQPPQEDIVRMMSNAVYLRYNGKFYVDYLTDDSVGIPEGVYYLGGIAEDGTVTDLIGDASQFPHAFPQSASAPAGSEGLSAITITPRQARLALLQSGLLDAVEAMVAAQPRAVQIQWDFATEINRFDLLVCEMLTALGLTSDQVDTLFNLASTF